MLLLGVLQAQAAGAVGGTFDLLETQVLTGSAASVTFSSLDTLAAGYQHLQIRATVRDTYTTVDTARLGLRFNGDTASNYSHHGLFGRGSSVLAFADTSQTIIRVSQDTPTNGKTTANTFAAVVIDILDFSNSSKYTTTRSLSGFAANDNLISLQSGNWRNTAAVTSIELSSLQGTALAEHSRFSIYGLRTGA